MITIESRRHTMRAKPGQNLTQAGVDLARATGETMGAFDRVITSTTPRAFQTAIAMGYAVDQQVESLNMIPDGAEDEVAWDAGFAAWMQAAQRGGIVHQYALDQAAFLRGIADSLPDGGAALLVSHGGIVEAQVAGCLLGADVGHLGPFMNYCEGVRLTYEDGEWTSATSLRVEK